MGVVLSRCARAGASFLFDHFDLRDRNRLAAQLAGDFHAVAGMLGEVGVLLVGDLEDLAVDDQVVERTAAHARLGAFAVRHDALVLGGFLVLLAARAVADLAGPRLLGRRRRDRDAQDRRREEETSCHRHLQAAVKGPPRQASATSARSNAWTRPVSTCSDRRAVAARITSAHASMISVQLVFTYPCTYSAGSLPTAIGQKLSRTLIHPAVSVDTDTKHIGTNVTQAYFARPALMMIVVPTASATEASSWLATPNIGQMVL